MAQVLLHYTHRGLSLLLPRPTGWAESLFSRWRLGEPEEEVGSGELEVEFAPDTSMAFLEAACLRMFFSLSTWS